ncbi:hypothetical protein GCM10011491_37210 [Brucella endophytica]|uniref:Type III secretion protein n=1 Tax=Brucella endophytica TaxID=1963359 RepID=A0A916SL10_9HYPH|nr:YscO family type III secretion system apparatus protein [Brucella endophytica]GGB05688.1 hypothetical protein GCM10011491_37210 [Brucella endophytica]
MSRAPDLAQLLALRRLREERANAALAIGSARLQEAIRLLDEADAAIDAHDREVDQQERRFFEALGLQPLPEREIGRAHDLLRVSDQRRDSLIDDRNDAAEMRAERERQLTSLRQEWRQRFSARAKLAEAESRLRIAEQARAEAASELETEEMSADGTRPVC